MEEDQRNPLRQLFHSSDEEEELMQQLCDFVPAPPPVVQGYRTTSIFGFGGEEEGSSSNAAKNKRRRMDEEEEEEEEAATSSNSASSSSHSDKGKGKEVMEEEEEGLSSTIDSSQQQFDATLFGQQLQAGFAKLHLSPLFSDMTLVLGEERLPAHRVVLCAWSDTFRAMLQNDTWEESRQSELSIQLEAKEHEAFKLMLRYMYTGDTTFINQHNIFSLLSVSNYYSIRSLRVVCEDLLKQHVTVTNVLSIIPVASLYNCDTLYEGCLSCMASNFEEVFSTKDAFAQVDADLLETLLRRDDLNVPSEIQIYNTVIRYIQVMTEPNDSQTLVHRLIPYVRFENLPVKFLVNVVEKEPLLQGNPVVHDLLHSAYRAQVCNSAQTAARRGRRSKGEGWQFQRSIESGTVFRSKQHMVPCTSGTLLVNPAAVPQQVACILPFSKTRPRIAFRLEAGENVGVGVVNHRTKSSLVYWSKGYVEAKEHKNAAERTNVAKGYAPGTVLTITSTVVSSDVARITFLIEGKIQARGTISTTGGIFPQVWLTNSADSVSIWQ